MFSLKRCHLHWEGHDGWHHGREHGEQHAEEEHGRVVVHLRRLVAHLPVEQTKLENKVTNDVTLKIFFFKWTYT